MFIDQASVDRTRLVDTVMIRKLREKELREAVDNTSELMCSGKRLDQEAGHCKTLNTKIALILAFNTRTKQNLALSMTTVLNLVFRRPTTDIFFEIFLFFYVVFIFILENERLRRKTFRRKYCYICLS